MFNFIGLPERFEPDAVQHNPDTLVSAFLKTESYRQANSEDASILYLIGNKGAGKSAIINKIHKDRYPRAIIFYYRDWFAEIGNNVEITFKANPTSDLPSLYVSEWRSVLWIEIIKSLYEEYRSKRNWWHPFDTGAYLDLFNYLVDNNLPAEIPLVSRFYYSLRRVREINIGGGGGKIDPSQQSDSYNTLAFNKVVGAIAKIVADRPFYLLIDEMDKVVSWNQNTRASLLGLIQATDSIIQSFSMKSKGKHGILIRIAVRGDMLTAATDESVFNQTINKVSIDPTWKQGDLEELVAQQLRDRWELPPNEVSRRKILSEVFPPYIIKDNQPFGYFGILSHNNPRSLYTLIKIALEKSLDKANIYVPLSAYSPSLLTIKRFHEVLGGYLNSQLKDKIGGSAFLFPGLSKLINEFIKNLGESFFSSDGVDTDQFVKEISKYISSKKGLKSQIEKWTTGDFSDTDKILKILYEINFIGFKEKSKHLFYPTEFKKTKTFIVDSIFYSTIFKNTLHIVKDNPIKRLEFAKENLRLAISNLTNEVGSTSARVINEKNHQPQSEYNPQPQTQTEYNPSNILHEAIRLIWSMRQLEKLLVAYGAELKSNVVKDAPSLVSKLNYSMEQLSECFGSSLHDLYTLSILSNTDEGSFMADSKEFERDMEKDENSKVFGSCKIGISNWIDMLGQEEYSDLPDNLQDILIPLQSVVSNIFPGSNVLPV